MSLGSGITPAWMLDPKDKCLQNRIGCKQYGPHLYKVSERKCCLCGQIKKQKPLKS